MRKISHQIVRELKTAKANVKLSKRDTVIVNVNASTYVLWNTPIVTYVHDTGELRWNESNFPWRGSNTTQRRFKELKFLLES